MMKRSRALGQKGWTLPGFLTPAEIEQLLTGNDATLEKRLMRRYTPNEVSGLQESILKSTTARPWRQVLKQAFSANDRREYLIVVPALLAVLEGLLAIVAGKLKKNDVRVRKWGEAQVAKQMPQSIHKVIWESVAAFVETAWTSSKFSGNKPPYLNRHWILHGREMQDVKKADVLQLLQAIYWVST